MLCHTSFVLLLFLTIISLISCDAGSSLTFVIDDSGSMEDDINQVRRGARDIMNIVLKHKSSQIKDIVLVTFNDPLRLTLLRRKTRDPNVLQASLNAIVAHNEDNYDWPEYSMSGVELALEESQPGSYLYVFTDASAKDYMNSHIVINLCQKTQSQIVFVLTDYCTNKLDVMCTVYHEVAEACSGQVFIVDKNEISKVLEYVKETVKGDKTIIKTRVIPAKQKTAIQFTIDDKTEYALISVSGDRVQISDLRGPTLTYEEVVYTSNVKILKLTDPVPGLYELKIYGESKVSVIIFGRTDFIFEHGFSEMTPKSLQDTSKQPISGTKNHLSISVNDPDHEVNIISAQILNMKEEIMHDVLPLRKISNDFYITDQFVAPNSMFKVAVIGNVTKTSKEIRRISKIPVEPQKPKIKPIEKKAPVSLIREGSKMSTAYDSTLRLTCEVTGYPAPSIIWKNDKDQVLPSKSYPVELPYKYISYLSLSHIKKSGKYHCYGINELDNTHSSIDVTALPAFTVDSNSKATLNVNYDKEVVIHCKIHTSIPHRINWFRTLNNKAIEQITSSNIYIISSDKTELKIRNMKINLQGKYTCKATLVADENENAVFDTEVKISDLAKPEIKQSKSTLTIREKTRIFISCIIKNGNPKPKITWQFQSKDLSIFRKLPNSGEQIEIVSPKLSDAGHYTCTAENELGKVQKRTELIVEAPPNIITDDKKEIYVAVEGDKVLKIPCKAVGYPKPVITWKAFGHPINTDNKYTVEQDGTLAIQKPIEKDTNDTYVCKATNKLGAATENYDVIVTSYLIHDDQFGNISKIYLREGESKQIKCVLYHATTDSITWYKEGLKTNITEPYLDFINSTQENDGNYTCRVSNNLGSNSHTYEVDVGYAPQFKLNFVSNRLEVDWKGNRNDIINCDATGKPLPMIKWIYNGKNVTSATETQLKIFDWGNYSCELHNPHGGIKRDFRIINEDCLIDRSNNAPSNMPLIITNSPTWRDLETQEINLILKSGVPLKFSCNNQASKPNSFARLSSKTEVTATCDHNNNYLVDGKVYTLSDLECKSKVMPTVVRTGTKCLYDNTEIIKVGFNSNDFVKIYEVCYDTNHHLPLYTRAEMSDVNNFAIVSEYKWYDYSGIGDNQSDKRYTCKTSSETCCYSKSQLISAHDVNYGPPQTSTFIDHLNAIPVWQPCDKNRITWQSLEDVVRSKYEDESEFSVWSGTSKPVTVNGKTIPRYLWKVVMSDQSETLVMVYVNDPQPVQSDIMCVNVCDVDPWDKTSDKFTYCCHLEDFVKAFNVSSNTFE